MTTTGDRLPYLLRALKAPRIAERLASTAERARAEGWAYEQFLEALCEADVVAREASGARQRNPRRWLSGTQVAGGLRTSPPSPAPSGR